MIPCRRFPRDRRRAELTGEEVARIARLYCAITRASCESRLPGEVAAAIQMLRIAHGVQHHVVEVADGVRLDRERLALQR